MFLSEFDFDLPEELIATRPASPRSSSRLLVARGNNIDDSFVNDLPKFLKSGDRIVLNDTKVLPARLSGIRNRSIEGNKTTSDPDAKGNAYGSGHPARIIADNPAQ